MNRRDVIVTALWALGTAAVVLGVLGPASIQADGVTGVKPENARPKLVAGGVELWVEMDGQNGAGVVLQPGVIRALRLVVRNATDQPAEVRYAVALSLSPPAPPESRMLPVPKEVWRTDDVVSLGAGESRTVALAPKAALAAGNRGVVSVRVGKQVLNALGISVPRPAKR